MRLVDVHFHPTDLALDQDLSMVMTRADKSNVVAALATGFDEESNGRILDLADEHPQLGAAVGIHPWFLPTSLPPRLDSLASQLANPHVVALGEIGLDGKIETPIDVQKHWFVAQLDLARQHGLPVVVHSRRAFEQTWDCVRQVPGVRGILHSFGGSPELAQRFIEQGWMISFSGSVTRPRARRIHRLAQALPASSIVLETDAPSIGMDGLDAGEVEPCHLPLVLHSLAVLRETSARLLARQTLLNSADILPRWSRIAGLLEQVTT